MNALHTSYALPEQIAVEPRRQLNVRTLDRILLCGSIGIGFMQAWVTRYSMSPDGISYLDMGNALARRDWAHAINAYWSPLYGWALGLTLSIVRPSAERVFPVVHAVNFGIFLLALFAFRFLLRVVLAFRRHPIHVAIDETKRSALPEWVFVLLGYAIFLWVSLDVVNIYDVSPDLAVLGCVCLVSGMLLRLHISPTTIRFSLFGFTLGMAYWVKAPMFPLGIAFLTLAFLWERKSRRWRNGMAVAVTTFLCAAAPLVMLLSVQKGRFTFGDSARLNYCWFVSPATPWRNWHGEVPGSGTPVHPTRALLRSPAVYEFDGPVAGAYPPWADPSYWNEGLRWHFKLMPQARALLVNLSSEQRLLLRERPELLVGIFLLVLLTGKPGFKEARALWPFFFIAAAALALYLPVHVEDRFLGGWLLLLSLVALATVRLSASDQRTAKYISIVVFALMLVATTDQTVRYATNHLSIPGVGPISAMEDVTAAERLSTVDLHAGDKIAFIGTGKGLYAAYLAKLQAIAEVMAYDHGYRDFWKLSAADKQGAYLALKTAGVKAILTTCPENLSGWRQVRGTTYCTLMLGQN